MFGEFVPGQLGVGAALSVPCALVTVWCTGMIYASLPTIRAWNQPLVPPVYVALALATGGVLMNLLLAVFGYGLRWAAIGTLLALVLAATLKRLYWTAIDTAVKTYTAESATGLGRFGDLELRGLAWCGLGRHALSGQVRVRGIERAAKYSSRTSRQYGPPMWNLRHSCGRVS